MTETAPGAAATAARPQTFRALRHRNFRLLWGGLVRIFLVHHATWLVNSLGHTFGTRPFRVSDRSTNNAAVALLTFGEGLHNNHHAFPSSAEHGLRWWQLDPTAWFIRLLAFVGLATEVKRAPRGARLSAKRRKPT